MRTAPRFLVFVLVVLSCSCLSAQSGASPGEQVSLLPAADSTAAWKNYAENLSALAAKTQMNLDAYSPYRDIMDHKRYEGLVMLLGYLKSKPVEGSGSRSDNYYFGGYFHSPVILAYQAKQWDLLKRLIQLDPLLLDIPDNGSESSGPSPLAVVVDADDLVWTKAFIAAGANAKTDSIFHIKGDDPETYNLYSVAHSTAMKDYLKSKGLELFFAFNSPKSTTCTDDSVRLRSTPGTQGAILGLLKKGEAIAVLGYNEDYDTIGEAKAHWYKIQYKGSTAWIFGAFIDTDALFYY